MTINLAMAGETADFIEQTAREADQQLLLTIIGGIAILVVSLGITGIMVTHRVVGPAFKMKSLFRHVADGHLKLYGRLREGDELQDVFLEFERMIEKLRWREFALIYVAYMGFLACRKNYGLWLPAVVSELGHSKGQAGILGSAMEFTYGTCSFLNGAVIDTYPAKHLLIAGLVLSAVANAENNHGLDVDNLVVAEAWVGKNLVMKRFHARGRGRSGPRAAPAAGRCCGRRPWRSSREAAGRRTGRNGRRGRRRAPAGRGRCPPPAPTRRGPEPARRP
jgi:hypothetical protein